MSDVENRVHGIAFVCTTCKHWQEGADKGMVDSDGDPVCSRSSSCRGPLSGGSFEQYHGPLNGYMAKFCHVCGTMATKAISPKGDDSRVGVCDACLEVIKGLAPAVPGKKIVFTTAKRAGGDKYEVFR